MLNIGYSATYEDTKNNEGFSVVEGDSMATNLPTDTENPVLTSNAPLSSPEQRRRPPEERVRTRNATARKLLQTWLADESGYEEETWPLLKQALEDNHSGSRKLFRD